MAANIVAHQRRWRAHLSAMFQHDKTISCLRAQIAMGAAGNLKDVSPANHAAEYSAPILIVMAREISACPYRSRAPGCAPQGAGKKEGTDSFMSSSR